MADILIVEDTDIQRQHAESQLDGHNLTFATTAEEVPEMEQFDFVLTGMFLPESKGDQPNYEAGLRIFEQACQLEKESRYPRVNPWH